MTGAITGRAFTAVLQQASPLWLTGTPTAPIYDYHAVDDEFAPVTADRQLMHRFCDAGVAVDHVEVPVGEHLSEAVAGGPGAMNYLAGRFADQAAPQTCASIPPGSGPLPPPPSG